MKDFDRVQLGAVRKMDDADHWFKRNAGVACRQEIHSHYKERWAAFFNKVMLRKGEGEL